MVKKKAQEKKAKLADYKIILGPVITEKAAHIGTKNASGVVFKVNPDADKDQIRRAVESVFKVEVARVRTSNHMGKVKRTGRSVGRRSSYKKAYVTLKPGNEINLFEGV